MNSTICQLCYPGAMLVGSINDTYHLMVLDEKYSLIEEPCHDGDVFLHFSFPPVPDPCQDVNTEMCGECPCWDASQAWLKKASVVMSQLRLPPESGYNFVLACKEAGWNKEQHGDLLFWLFDFCGRLITPTEQA